MSKIIQLVSARGRGSSNPVLTLKPFQQAYCFSQPSQSACCLWTQLASFTFSAMSSPRPAAPAMQLSLPVSVLTSCKSQLSLANPFPLNWGSPALVCTKFTTRCKKHLGGHSTLQIYVCYIIYICIYVHIHVYIHHSVLCFLTFDSCVTCGDILSWFGSEPRLAISVMDWLQLSLFSFL